MHLMLMQYSYSMKTGRMTHLLTWNNVAVCFTNPLVFCEITLSIAFHTLLKYAPAVWWGHNATRCSEIAQQDLRLRWLLQPDLLNMAAGLHYARGSGHIESKTGKTFILMQINFARERGIKHIITHINLYLQIVLRKKISLGVMRGYTRGLNWV